VKTTCVWDERKARTNRRQHGVSFRAAAGVFDDANSVEFIDREHSTEEETRYARIGLSGARLLYMVYTEVSTDVVRIIHARRANKRMEMIYEGKEDPEI